MRTSLNEIACIEKYLLGSLPLGKNKAIALRLMYDKAFEVNVLIQRRVYKLIRQYGRKSLKEEAEIVHRRLFEDPAHQRFQESIYQLFNNYQ